VSGRTYPSKNPFPHQGISSLEGKRLEPGSRHARRALARTHPFAAVEDSLRALRAYLDGYEEHAEKEGLVAAVGGEYGTGKTHTIRYAATSLARDVRLESRDGGKPPELRQLYGKADDDQLIAVFCKLTADLDATFMAELNSAFLKSITAETSDAHQSISVSIEKLKQNPGLIDRLFESGIVEEGAVRSEQAKEVGSTKRRKEFQDALYYASTVPDLQTPAFEWLCGRQISEKARRRLGVKGPLASGEDAKSALGLIARLFKHAGIPLIIYIDQYEKLVLRSYGSPHGENIGILRSLVDTVANEQGAVILAGIPAAWAALTPDLRERIGNNRFELTTLKLEEARDIVTLYLKTPEEPLGAGADDANLYPFQPEAIRTMLSLGGGNLRRLLQLCSSVFAAARLTEASITPELVEEIAGDRESKYFDRQSVIDDIEQILIQRSLVFKKTLRSDIGFDLEVTSRKGATLLIKAEHALFHDDEAETALQTISDIKKAREAHPIAQVVLIASGYVSPEVIGQVRKVAQQVIVYLPDSFAKELGALLDSFEGESSVPASAVAAQAASEQLSQELAEIRRDLKSLSESRSKEAQILEERFIKLLEKQSAERKADQQLVMMNTWTQERNRIKKRIQDVRREREKRDLEEIDKLQSIALRQRWSRTLITAATIMLALWVILSLTNTMIEKFYPESKFYFDDLFVIPTSIVFAFIVLAVRWNLDQRYTELVRSFDTLEELRRAARNHKGPHCLLHPIPQVRYAVAMYHRQDIEEDDILKALRIEPAVLIRDALARLAGKRLLEAWDSPAEDERGTRDAAHFLESWIEHGGSELPPGWKKSATMVTLAAIFGIGIVDSTGLAASLAYARYKWRSNDSKVPRRVWNLAEAFGQSVAHAMAVLDDVSRDEVEKAIEELSPFDRGGLGTFDGLQCIREIDAYYLFFRQLLFLIERR
jgi:hypothetical protein